MKIKNWFSNFVFFDTPFIHKNISYKSPEHFYQAMKSSDPEVHKRIADLETPGQTKRAGKEIDIRPDWEDIKLDVMEQALRYKFRRDTSHGRRLISTTEPIVEYNYWHDNFWGFCMCDKCKNKTHLNHLGRLLEKIKADISY